MPPYFVTDLLGGFLGGVIALTVLHADTLRKACDRLLCAVITSIAGTWLACLGLVSVCPSIPDGAQLHFFGAVVIGAIAWFAWHWPLNYCSRRTGRELFDIAAEVLRKVARLKGGGK